MEKLPKSSNRGLVILSITIWIIILLLSDRGHIEGDGIVRWEALNTLMTEGRLTDDIYSIVQPMLAAPLYGIGYATARLIDDEDDTRKRWTRHFVQRFNKIVAFSLVLWIFLTLRIAGRWSVRDSALAATFMLFGSLLIPHSKGFYSEGLWSLMSISALSMYCSMITYSNQSYARWRAVLIAALIALTIPLNPMLLPVWALTVGMWCIYHAVSDNKNSIYVLVREIPHFYLIPALGCVAGCGLTFLENRIRRGDILDFGYAEVGFTGDFLYGLAGQLFAPSRGIIYFIPVFFCGFILYRLYAHEMGAYLRRLTGLSLVFSLLLVAGYSKWVAWHGASYWGPRFLLFLSIAGTLYYVLLIRHHWPVGSLLQRISLAGLGIISYMIYKVGVSISHRHLLVCLEQAPNPEACYWKWRFLPYYSWVDSGDLATMLMHRSTLVEILGAVFIYALLRTGHTNSKSTIKT